jgi:hypothetical protein
MLQVLEPAPCKKAQIKGAAEGGRPKGGQGGGPKAGMVS